MMTLGGIVVAKMQTLRVMIHKTERICQTEGALMLCALSHLGW